MRFRLEQVIRNGITRGKFSAPLNSLWSGSVQEDLPAVKFALKSARPFVSARTISLVGASTLVLAVGACQQADKAPAPQESAAADNGPSAKPGISASDGHFVLPVVAGRPGAVYFTVRNDGAAPVKLVGVHIEGAESAQMHRTDGGSMAAVESLDIAPGAQVEFRQGGLHVMAFGIEDSVKASGMAELTLTFSDGDKLSMPLRVETMGGDAGGDHGAMPGMGS